VAVTYRDRSGNWGRTESWGRGGPGCTRNSLGLHGPFPISHRVMRNGLLDRLPPQGLSSSTGAGDSCGSKLRANKLFSEPTSPITKAVYVYPLCRHVQQRLRTAPAPGCAASAEAPDEP
jgi:hypothetical protein